jgi:hypothetical protein
MKKYLLVILFILLLATPVFGASVYIDPTAGGGGDGTCATPYDSWADVSGSFNASNDYYQKVGTTETITTSTNVTTSGTSINDIVIGAYSEAAGPVCTDNVTTGTKPIIKYAAAEGGTGFLVNASYIYFEYLELQNMNNGFNFGTSAATTEVELHEVDIIGGTDVGINITPSGQACSNHTINNSNLDNNYTGGAGDNGIVVWECTGVQILNTTIDGFEHASIEFRKDADNGIIRNVLLTNDNSVTNHPISILDGTSGMLVEYVWIDNVGNAFQVNNTSDSGTGRWLLMQLEPAHYRITRFTI